MMALDTIIGSQVLSRIPACRNEVRELLRNLLPTGKLPSRLPPGDTLVLKKVARYSPPFYLGMGRSAHRKIAFDAGKTDQQQLSKRLVQLSAAGGSKCLRADDLREEIL